MKHSHDQPHPHAPPLPQLDTVADADRSAASVPDGTMEPLLPVALTVVEVAGLLRLDPRTIREMVRSGELEGNQRGHAIRVSRTSALDWLRGKRRVPRSKR